MDRDTQILILLIGFPVLLTAGVVFLVLLSRWNSTIACPTCERRMPKPKGDVKTECHYCRQQDEVRPNIVGATGNCAACGRRDEAGSRLCLWDGRAYCRNCLFNASPTLAHFAETNAVLSDAAPWPVWRVWLQNFVFFEFSIIAVFGGLMSVAVVAEGKPEEVTMLIGAFALLGLIVAIPFSIASALGYRNIRPAVRICDGAVDLWLGDTGYEHCDLATLEWYVGTTSFVGQSMVPFQKSVFLVFPSTVKSSIEDEPNVPSKQSELIVPVGFTAENRERWIAFLALAAIPRRSLWERRNVLLNTVVVAGGIAIFPLGFFASLWVAATLERNLAARGVAADIAAAITHPIFFPGFFFALPYILAFYPWRMVPRVPSSKPPEEQRRFRRRVALGVAGFGLYSMVMTVMGEKGFGPTAQAIAVAEILVLTAVCAFDYSRRVAFTELATTPESLAKKNANS